MIVSRRSETPLEVLPDYATAVNQMSAPTAIVQSRTANYVPDSIDKCGDLKAAFVDEVLSHYEIGRWDVTVKPLRFSWGSCAFQGQLLSKTRW